MGISCASVRRALDVPTTLASICLPLCVGCTSATEPVSSTGSTGAELALTDSQAELAVSIGPRSIGYDFANVTYEPAGVAAGETVYFIGDPLEGRVFAYSRLTGAQIGELPQPPGGFSVPFIMH